MMDSIYGALAVVPAIVGLVEVAMRQGLPARWATPLAVALGVAMSVAYTLAAGLPGGTALADAALRGLVLGLSAAGLSWGFRARFGPERGARSPSPGRRRPRARSADVLEDAGRWPPAG